jgi:hypothetical protein
VASLAAGGSGIIEVQTARTAADGGFVHQTEVVG